jgi:hypothetical protein
MSSEVVVVRRYIECTTLVVLWMVAQVWFHLSPIAGQLVGIPLILVFQWAVARRPISELWAFDAIRIPWTDRWMWAIAAALGLGSGSLLWLSSGHRAAGLTPPVGLFLLVLAAVIPAAFALRQQRWLEFRSATPWLMAAVAFRFVWRWAWSGRADVISADKALDFITIWACEAVALFLVDEVAFRGAIDPYLCSAAAGQFHAWCSALFGSILWSLWHLPAYNPGARSIEMLWAGLSPFYLSVVINGVLFVFAARRGRTLLGSAVAHALVNAYILAQFR